MSIVLWYVAGIIVLSVAVYALVRSLKGRAPKRFQISKWRETVVQGSVVIYNDREYTVRLRINNLIVIIDGEEHHHVPIDEVFPVVVFV